MIKEIVQQLVQQAVAQIGAKDAPVGVEHPVNLNFGDYTTNIAMRLSKQLKKSPLQIAEEIVKAFPSNDIIEKTEIIKPGFINIWIKSAILESELTKILTKKDDYGRQTKKKFRTLVEFTDPNPFKEFHIGHLYSNTVGESLSRLHEMMGEEVIRVCYQGDVGLHVAKAIWGMQQILKQQDLTPGQLANKPLKERAEFMGKAYALGAAKYETDETIKEEIYQLNKKIYEADPEIHDLYQKGRSWSLEYFETIYQRLGTKFEAYFFESNTGKIGLAFVKEYLQKGIFKESEGAIVFPGEEYGLHTRVFINKLGLPTYEAKDLGLAKMKEDTYHPDLSIIITGNEINEYFKVVLKALEIINPELRNKTIHLSHGMVRLPEGKMSSRTGNVITGAWLLNEASKHAFNIIQKETHSVVEGSYIITDKNSRLNAHDQYGSLPDKVGIAAIKYALLKNSIGKDVEFNFKESISFEGNSGPYLQYTYVRCLSVLAKSDSAFQLTAIQMNQEESELVRTLYIFPELLENAAKLNAPNLVCTYLYELAQKFNLFYQKHPILKAEEEQKQFRLALTAAVAQVIKNGLQLLGIETVEKM